MQTSGRSLDSLSAPVIIRLWYDAAFGIFYEGDVFNNTLNSRQALIKTGLFNDTNHSICGGTNSLTLPDGSVVSSDGGVSIADICMEPLSQAGQHFINLQNLFQQVTKSVGPASNGQYVGNTLTIVRRIRSTLSNALLGTVERRYPTGDLQGGHPLGRLCTQLDSEDLTTD